MNFLELYALMCVWTFVNNDIGKAFDQLTIPGYSGDVTKSLKDHIQENLLWKGFWNFMWFVTVFFCLLYPFVAPIVTIRILFRSYHNWTTVVEEVFNDVG